MISIVIGLGSVIGLLSVLAAQPSLAQPIEPPHPGGRLQADCFPGPHSGALTVTQDWCPEHNPHQISGNFHVPDGFTLTLRPGVSVQTASGQRLQVSGALIGQGTPAEPITLTSSADSGPGQWAGILLSQGDADLRHVTVRYAGQSNTWGYAAINLANNASLYLANSEIRESQNAVNNDFGVHLCCGNSRAVISHTRFYSLGNTTTDAAILSTNDGDPITVTNSLFENNAAYPIQAPLSSAPRLTGNTFSGNSVNRILLVGGAPTDGSHLTAQTGLQGYELTSDLVVNNGRTLHIDPGVGIYSRNNIRVLVHGHLNASGTAAQPITFTSATDSGPQQWGCLYMQDGAADLRHVTVRYAGQAVCGVPGALFLQSTSGPQRYVTLDHVTVRDNANTSGAPEYAVSVNGSHVTLTDTAIINNGDAAIDYGLYLNAGVITGTRTTVSGNAGVGLYVLDRASLTCGAVTSNTRHGLQVAGNGQLAVLGVDLFGNGGAGLTNTTLFTATAGYNWWGDASGPGGVGPGSGDEVSARVAFTPWLTRPGCTPELLIAKTGPAHAVAGELITYTLIVTNAGATAATNLVISDVLPVGAVYAGGGTLIGNVVRFEAPALAGQGVSHSVQFAVTADHSITNSQYAVTAAGGQSAIGLAAVTTQVSPACDPLDGLDFTFAPGTPRIDQTVAFTATVTAGTPPITYTWQWGDGTPVDVGSFATHQFPAINVAATYTVTLMAANACTAGAAREKPVTVWPHRLYLPLVYRG
jgi:uncharacterized repeat protein (TIGR01451 family)